MGTLIISFLWFGGTEVTGAESFFFKVASLDSCVSPSSPRAETLHLPPIPCSGYPTSSRPRCHFPQIYHIILHQVHQPPGLNR